MLCNKRFRLAMPMVLALDLTFLHFIRLMPFEQLSPSGNTVEESFFDVMHETFTRDISRLQPYGTKFWLSNDCLGVGRLRASIQIDTMPPGSPCEISWDARSLVRDLYITNN